MININREKLARLVSPNKPAPVPSEVKRQNVSNALKSVARNYENSSTEVTVLNNTTGNEMVEILGFVDPKNIRRNLEDFIMDNCFYGIGENQDQSVYDEHKIRSPYEIMRELDLFKFDSVDTQDELSDKGAQQLRYLGALAAETFLGVPEYEKTIIEVDGLTPPFSYNDVDAYVDMQNAYEAPTYNAEAEL